MALNSRQKHVYKANMYVFGHRSTVNGKIVVTKNHNYPLCADCSKFRAWKLTASICTHNGVKLLCQDNRIKNHETRKSNGCGNQGRFFIQSKEKSYIDSYNKIEGKKSNPLALFFIAIIFMLGLMFF